MSDIRPISPLDVASLAPIFERARQALAEAHDLDEVKTIRDQAQAIQAYLHQQHASLEMQNNAAEINLRAQRRLGELLVETVHPGNPQLSHDAIIANGRLPDGVTLSQSSRWQQIARLPEPTFEKLVRERKEQDEELTTAYILRAAQGSARVEKVPAPLPPGVFDVLYADPPWPYENQIKAWGPTSLHYESMSLDSLVALDVSSKAADNSTLFLWVTNPFLREALGVSRAWGFEYKTNIVWVKTNLQRPGSGFYVRGRHELLLICTRGSHVPDQTGQAPIGSVLMADVQEHSRKPSEVYSLIEQIYPGARYIELFLRGAARPGWVGWGDQADG